MSLSKLEQLKVNAINSIRRVSTNNDKVLIGYFSVINGVVNLNCNALKEVALPLGELNLKDGFDARKYYGAINDQDTPFQQLLYWIRMNKTADELDKVEFVCLRGLIKDLMNANYDSRKGILIHAVKYRKTIYLIERITKWQKAKEEQIVNNPGVLQNMNLFAGPRYEKYCISAPTVTNADGDEIGIFKAVYERDFGDEQCQFRLLYSAEIDGFQTNKEDSELVEVKIRRDSTEWRETDFRENKSRLIWIQADLALLDKIIFGVCGEDDFKVIRSEVKTLDELREMGGDWKNEFRGESHLCQLLNDVKQAVQMSGVVYQFYKKENTKKWGPARKLEGYLFLPNAFIDAFQLHPN